ncbi:MAG: pseudouridine synthase [Leadbetterella sp.]
MKKASTSTEKKKSSTASDSSEPVKPKRTYTRKATIPSAESSPTIGTKPSTESKEFKPKRSYSRSEETASPTREKKPSIRSSSSDNMVDFKPKRTPSERSSQVGRGDFKPSKSFEKSDRPNTKIKSKASFNRTSQGDRPDFKSSRSFDRSNKPSGDFTDKKPSFDRSSSRDKGDFKPTRSFDRFDKPSGDFKDKKPSFDRSSSRDKGDFKPTRSFDRSNKPSGDFRDKKPSFDRSAPRDRGDFKPNRSFDRSDKPSSDFRDKKPSFDRSAPRDRGDFKPSRSFDRSDKPSGDYRDKKPAFDRSTPRDRGDFKPTRSFDRSDKPSSDFRDKKPSFDRSAPRDRSDFKPTRNFDRSDKPSGDFRDKKPFNRSSDSDKGDSRPKRAFDKSDKPSNFRERGDFRKDEKPFSPRSTNRGAYFDEPQASKEKVEFSKQRGLTSQPDITEKGMLDKLPERIRKKVENTVNNTDDIRLNRFIANAGLCSRREADEFIASGQITVNGAVVTEMGYKVKPTDTIKYGRKILNRQKLTYVLLNKPKDFITTMEDPEGRKTVMDLVKNATNERIYPIGRLDRATTGLLLLTNDGELAEKLSHPSNNVKKIYQLEIDKKITQEHFDQILEGIELEDGKIKADDLSIISPDGMVLGIEIHSGRNRIVRRIFEQLGYEVLKLDRSTYAGLSKKDLPRGNWRFLTEKEVIRLKYMI